MDGVEGHESRLPSSLDRYVLKLKAFSPDDVVVVLFSVRKND